MAEPRGMCVLSRTFAKSNCGMLRRVTFCANRKLPKNRLGGGDCDFPAS